jgi:hypothetical protein
VESTSLQAVDAKVNVMQASDHNLLLLGPPGAGTSMLARRLTTILPAMTLVEAIETTRIHRVAGRTGTRTALVTTRPFRAPHHTISDVGLIGGGHVPMPGEVSLAHHGMLFLMNCQSADATSLRSCANHSRRVSQAYNLQSVLNLCDFMSFANRLLTASRSGRVQEPSITTVTGPMPAV